MKDGLKLFLNSGQLPKLHAKEVYKSRDYVLVYDTEQDIKNIKINRQLFDQINLNTGGVIVTSKEAMRIFRKVKYS